MPTFPEIRNLTARSVDILNAIRNSASANYRDYIPVADPSQESIREIGAVIMQYPTLQNEFLNALINRIGRVIITSRMFSNPWSMFKKGLLEFGETVEDIFVNIAKPFKYDAETAETNVFRREIPDVRAAFYVLNFQKFYKQTIQQEQLRQAFLSWNGISDLIAKITDAMYTGANYDEFLTMKYLLARQILNGRLFPVTIAEPSANTAKAIVSKIKGVSNTFEFPSTRYNMAGVTTYSDKSSQYIIVNAEFDAVMDVEVLASAFNMSKADFMGHRILVDSFGSLDTDRLDLLFANDPAYTSLTDEEVEALDAIPAVLVDENWFMIFDNMMNFTEQYNGEGLYWNYWLHVWKTFAVSPFANSAVFVPGEPAIVSVTVTPSTATVGAGQTILLTAEVETENFASKAVNWTSSVTEGVAIDPLGNVTIDADVASGTTITITATSVIDSTKSDTCTLTVA